MAQLGISVTQDHIKQGRMKNPFNDPIALAFKEKLNAIDVCVFTYSVTADGRTFYPVNFKTVFDFICTFDKGNPVSPVNLFYVEKSDA